MPDFTVTLPFNLVNGTTADANEVMANYQALRNGHNNAFNAATGHTHSGSTGDGPVLSPASLDLAANYDWTGIHTHANFLDVYNGFDLRIFADAGITNRGSWDGATGNFFTDGNIAFESGTTFNLTLDHAITAPRTWIFPDFSDTFVGLTGVQALTNKTLTSPSITNPTITGTVGGSATYTTPTLTIPVIANFSSAIHSHLNAAGGGTLDTAAITSGVFPVARGGTGTGTAFTSGSVVFADGAGVYAQDNANFFWDDTNNRLGIGTAAPSTEIHLIKSSVIGANLRVENTIGGASLNLVSAATSDWSWTAVGSQLNLNDNEVGSIQRLFVTDNFMQMRFPNAANSSAAEFFFMGQITSTTTVNAVATTVWTTANIPLGSDDSIFLEARVASLNTVQSIRAYRIVHAYGRRNGAGAATIDATSVTTTTVGAVGASSIAWVAVGNTVELQVTGVGATNIKWEGTVFCQHAVEP